MKGLEPLNIGVKNRCLATWLHSKIMGPLRPIAIAIRITELNSTKLNRVIYSVSTVHLSIQLC